MELNLEWDRQEANANLRKHGVSIEEASSIFLDEIGVDGLDQTHSTNELRLYLIGLSDRNRILIVTYALENISDASVKIRLVCAKLANREERRKYES